MINMGDLANVEGRLDGFLALLSQDSLSASSTTPIENLQQAASDSRSFLVSYFSDFTWRDMKDTHKETDLTEDKVKDRKQTLQQELSRLPLGVQRVVIAYEIQQLLSQQKATRVYFQNLQDLFSSVAPAVAASSASSSSSSSSSTTSSSTSQIEGSVEGDGQKKDQKEGENSAPAPYLQLLNELDSAHLNSFSLAQNLAQVVAPDLLTGSLMTDSFGVALLSSSSSSSAMIGLQDISHADSMTGTRFDRFPSFRHSFLTFCFLF
jgi:hypothetical protein